jgi:hypothetical protein
VAGELSVEHEQPNNQEDNGKSGADGVDSRIEEVELGWIGEVLKIAGTVSTDLNLKRRYENLHENVLDPTWHVMSADRVGNVEDTALCKEIDANVLQERPDE